LGEQRPSFGRGGGQHDCGDRSDTRHRAQQGGAAVQRRAGLGGAGDLLIEPGDGGVEPGEMVFQGVSRLPIWARAAASTASVLARRPIARAKSRACRSVAFR